MTDQSRGAWPALLHAQGRIADRLDRDLIEQAEITLAEFEVLDRLAGSPGHTVRMNELAEQVRLSPSGLTRRFDTLVRRGWVTREPCDDDRRGINARITEAGLDKHGAAVGVHDSGVSAYMLDNLDDSEIECLTTVLNRLGEANTITRTTRITAGAKA